MHGAAHDRQPVSVINRRDQDVGFLLNFAFVFSGAKGIRLHHERRLRDLEVCHERRQLDGRYDERMPNGTGNERD
jgi:hypothetical protein